MKNTRKLLTLVLFSLICLFAFSFSVFAANAVKVNKVMSHKPIQLIGKDANNKTVWTYNAEDAVQTELCSVTHLVKGKFVYVIDNNKFVRLRLKDGKVMNKTQLPDTVYSATMLVDSAGNLYAIGYYRNDVYKINKKGKIIWKSVLDNKYYWPYKMKLTGKKLQISFDGPGSPKSCVLNTKTGKVLK